MSSSWTTLTFKTFDITTKYEVFSSLRWMQTLLIHWLLKHWYCNWRWNAYLFKMTVNLINTLALKTLILQLNMKGFIIIMSCHQHGYPWPSLATPPYHPSLLAGPPGYIPYLHRMLYVGRSVFAWPCDGAHKSTSLISLTLLLQQCPVYLVHLILIVFMMGSRWP